MASRSGRRGVLVEPADRKTFLEKLGQHESGESLSASSSNNGGSGSAAVSPSQPSRPRSKRTLVLKKKKRSSETERPRVGKEQITSLRNSVGRADAVAAEEGCLVCRRDDDHGNLMICEGCSSEYHYYCLDPPLRSVPHGEWFCDKCKPVFQNSEDDDGLERLVAALPPRFTERFAEVVWAQGGSGFGWWPAAIYDPRLTTGGARELARKQLGKKHLVYFFECHGAPFSALTETKIMEWDLGLSEDNHLGKTASSAGKTRTEQFRAAFQVAIVELGKPIDTRLDWNHNGTEEEHLPSPTKFPTPRRQRKDKKKKRRNKDDNEGDRKRRKRTRQPDKEGSLQTVSPASRRNLLNALERQVGAANEIESVDGKLYCKILKRVGEHDINIGFVRLESREATTFADARRVIAKELDDDSLPSHSKWKFYVPSLGPISFKQERLLGAMIPFLQSACGEQLGNGSLQLPLQLLILE